MIRSPLIGRLVAWSSWERLPDACYFLIGTASSRDSDNKKGRSIAAAAPDTDTPYQSDRYFDMPLSNMRSIFSFVASQQACAWLAAFRAWLAVL